VSDLEDSDDEPVSDDLEPYTWTAGGDDRNQYEILLVYALTEKREFQGHDFDVSQRVQEAIPQLSNVLNKAEAAFGRD
jgi:hypothetical protein